MKSAYTTDMSKTDGVDKQAKEAVPIVTQQLLRQQAHEVSTQLIKQLGAASIHPWATLKQTSPIGTA